MKRQTKLLTMALVLVVLLGGYAGLRAITDDDADAVAEVEDITLWAPDADTLTAMTWTYGDETVSLARSDGESDWYYVNDSDFPVNQDTVYLLETYLSSVTASQELTEFEDLAEYGLDEPELTVEAETEDGESHSFAFGAQNAITADYYALMDGEEDTVWLIASTIPTYFSIELFDIMETESIPYMSTITAVTLQRDGETLAMEYVEDNEGLAYTDQYNWFIRDGEDYTALDTSKVGTLTGYVSDLEWADSVSYNAGKGDLAQWGLDSPAVSIAIDYESTSYVDTGEVDDDGNAVTEEQVTVETLILHLGDYSGTACYAMLDGSSMVYLVDGSVIDALLYTQEADLLPDDICLLDIDELTGFDVTLDGETYSIVRDGTMVIQAEEEDEEDQEVTRYTLDGQELDTDSVESLISQISALTATDTVDGAGSRSEELSFTFYRDTETFSELTLAFHLYDSTSCLVEFNGEMRLLADRDDVDSLISAVEALLD